jgi:hypothetical protein
MSSNIYCQKYGTGVHYRTVGPSILGFILFITLLEEKKKKKKKKKHILFSREQTLSSNITAEGSSGDCF